jgi:hypothetical protein
MFQPVWMVALALVGWGNAEHWRLLAWPLAVGIWGHASWTG